jgi:uncharacterized protein (TIGR03086 family)
MTREDDGRHGSFFPLATTGRMGPAPDAGPAGIVDDHVMTNWEREVERLVAHGRDREAAALAVRHLSAPTRQGESMDPLEQFDLLAPALGGVVTQIGAGQLDEPTPCTDFTVRGVLEHMIAGAIGFAAAFRGEPAPPANGDGDGGADPRGRFAEAMTGLVDAVRSPGALDRTIAAPFGDVPGQIFARFVVLDGLVHGWDLAIATGRPYQPPVTLVAEVDAFAREAIVPAMREAEMFAAPVKAPTDATPIERLVALTGRRVERSSG